MNSINEAPKFPRFEKRYFAWIVDALVIGIIIYLARMVFVALCMQFHTSFATGKLAMINLGIGLVIAIAYHVIFESSSLQATPGKLFFSMVVTDLEGNRITKIRAFARHMGKYASVLTLGLGYALYFTSSRKQCLHDLMARCLIVNRNKT
ncbi:MAG: RDD family protein [Candidatus Obscuribacterales bacterium]|nr:RDD family protein [Candidatus Obscuribacterales bacterium]